MAKQIKRMAQALANKANNFLLTITTDGAPRPAKAIVSCKKNGHTSEKGVKMLVRR